MTSCSELKPTKLGEVSEMTDRGDSHRFAYTDSDGDVHEFWVPKPARNFDVDKICVRCHNETRTSFLELCRRFGALDRGACYGKLIPIYQWRWEMQKWRTL